LHFILKRKGNLCVINMNRKTRNDVADQLFVLSQETLARRSSGSSGVDRESAIRMPLDCRPPHVGVR
jgi:hypothetical protein